MDKYSFKLYRNNEWQAVGQRVSHVFSFSRTAYSVGGIWYIGQRGDKFNLPLIFSDGHKHVEFNI